MAGKIWVDIDEFTTAWLVALVLHGHGRKAKAGFIRQRLCQITSCPTSLTPCGIGAADQADDALGGLAKP